MSTDNKPVGWHPSSLTRLCQLLYLTLPVNHLAGPLSRAGGSQLSSASSFPQHPAVLQRLGACWGLCLERYLRAKERAAPEPRPPRRTMHVAYAVMPVMPKTTLATGS